MNEAAPLFGDILVKLGLVSELQVQDALVLQSNGGTRIGEALVLLGHLKREQLRALVELMGIADVERLTRPRLGDILVKLGRISHAQRDDAVARQRQDGRRLGEILVDRGYCSYQAIYEARNVQSGIPVAGDSSPPPLIGTKKVRVLVVDDSMLVRAVVCEGLTELGFDVVELEDPFAVLEQILDIQPAIVVSDLEMPGMDGATLCRRLKEGRARRVPVIILTANVEDTKRVTGLRAGAEDYVSKTASIEELGARIETVVRRTSEAERIRKLFVRYTSDAVVEQTLNSGDVVLTGEKREVTVLFADLRNFTALADTLGPEQIVGILNDVLGRLSESVLATHGTLDKFLGDGLMAIFGAPLSQPDDAVRAVRTAQMMMAALDSLRDEYAAAFKQGEMAITPPDLALGIGINTGIVVAGNIGGDKRTEYTVIGDAVNVAARLCALAAPNEILLGNRTRDLVAHEIELDSLQPVLVKGKVKPIPVFRVPR